ncbi:MAG: MOSC domain-containing protein [Pedobacter sp.]|nr:MAG: MOSC domain-containing protein [Pedobacter sp.]
MPTVSALYIYPIKSLGGIAVNSAQVTDRGFQYDRRWMLVDENNIFLSQREIAHMALLKVEITDEGLWVSHKINGDNILIPFIPKKTEICSVIVWDDTCNALYVSNEADAWFSGVLSVKCRLVYMPDDSRRVVDANYSQGGELTSFSDAYPFLLIGQSSLDDLNSRIAEELPMNRFRPNIVFTGGEPYVEDAMKKFSINGIRFKGVKPSARCVITTTDQETGVRYKEPIKTLATYRRRNNMVYFGQNLVHNGEGVIAVGDILQGIVLHDEKK